MVVQTVLPRLQNMRAYILTRIRRETQYHLNLTMQKLTVKQRIQGRLCFIFQTLQRQIKFGNGLVSDIVLCCERRFCSMNTYKYY